MSTHLPGFQWFFTFFASICIGQVSHQQHRGLRINAHIGWKQPHNFDILQAKAKTGIRRVAKCQNYTFDGVFRYKSSSMLIHLYIGWALAYGWMTCLLLLHKGILGHFMQKITKKVCFLGFPSRKFIFRDRNSKLATNVFKRMLLIIEHVALVWLQWTPCCEWFWGKNHQK